ncbi:unnamed protein product [Protopolystoma xenopodis]|uniref:Uncharacterized protein n=1 Tax=Protopolystoma xenopodis TaxID=117903 RepID=A0A3S5AVX6_9PLAT|nr:unnamed protein product [Protopolystoma xenopodis]
MRMLTLLQIKHSSKSFAHLTAAKETTRQTAASKHSEVMVDKAHAPQFLGKQILNENNQGLDIYQQINNNIDIPNNYPPGSDTGDADDNIAFNPTIQSPQEIKNSNAFDASRDSSEKFVNNCSDKIEAADCSISNLVSYSDTDGHKNVPNCAKVHTGSPNATETHNDCSKYAGSNATLDEASSSTTEVLSNSGACIINQLNNVTEANELKRLSGSIHFKKHNLEKNLFVCPQPKHMKAHGKLTSKVSIEIENTREIAPQAEIEDKQLDPIIKEGFSSNGSSAQSIENLEAESNFTNKV